MLCYKTQITFSSLKSKRMFRKFHPSFDRYNVYISVTFLKALIQCLINYKNPAKQLSFLLLGCLETELSR